MEYYCCILLIAANAFITNALPYDTAEDAEDRIIGGDPVDIKDIPYQVAVNRREKPHCGGSIISPKFILSAAHCFQTSNPDEITVRAGSNNSVDGGLNIAVKKIHNHEKFNLHPSRNDIAILELTQNLPKDNDNIKIIQLAPSNKNLKPGTMIRVSGWGGTTDILGAPGSKVLRAVTVPIVSYEDCKRIYEQVLADYVTNNNICAGYKEGGKDSCYGDSGGPAASEDGKTLYGIVSFGAGCAKPNIPGVYESVAAHRDWIKNITGL